MPKFTFICEHEADQFYGARENRVTFEAETYEDVLAEVNDFLRGSGYYFKGNVDIVDHEAIEQEAAAREFEEAERAKWNFGPLEEAMRRIKTKECCTTCNCE